MDLAKIYSAQDKHENAQDIYNAVLAKHADFIPAIFGKAAIYDLQGNKRQAQELYKEILEKDENYAPALNNLAYMYLDVYADPKEALQLAVKAFRNSPGDPGIMDTLGYALLKNGQVDKSIVFLEKAAMLVPKEAAIRLHLGQAYKAAGRRDDAVASLMAIDETNAQQAQIKQAQSLLKELN
jgi:tetratricopeptide (TPR) repeat protein